MCRLRSTSRFGLALALGLLAGGGFAARSQNEERNVWEGVYTAEQAQRGKSLYAETCRSCHLDNLLGGGQTPSLAGDGFVSNWDSLTVRDLYSRIRTTMPADRPGSLSEQIAADIVAYLLQANNFPVGENELKGDGEALQKIKITKSKP